MIIEFFVLIIVFFYIAHFIEKRAYNEGRKDERDIIFNFLKTEINDNTNQVVDRMSRSSIYYDLLQLLKQVLK